MAEELPKQDLLLKMLNMTTVAEDTMAVVAIRKANALLREAGWTWEKLLAGKIVVVEDPFSALKTPSSSKGSRSAPTPPPPPPPSPFRPAPQPAPRAAPRAAASPPPRPQAPSCLSSKKNIYPGFCYNCGDHVPSEKGFVFNPKYCNSRAPDKWVITCFKCNSNVKMVLSSPAPKQNNSWTATPSAGPAPKLDTL